MTLSPPIFQVKLILEDTSAALDQVVCHILLELCEDKDGMSDSFHCEALNLLMTLCQAITEQVCMWLCIVKAVIPSYV